ncbi:hypothetical protein GCM10009547_24480 [Sporichthya brevicatena]|uniref:Uncharacterized protein n=2 Tax=Sporichthya brevicatena TaxID=171442 RepID=A0ABN1GVS4_9ACTN
MSNLVHDWARRVPRAVFSGTIPAMSRHRTASLTLLGSYDAEVESRRVNRGSALLLGLAVVCAAVTVAFGIWMAGVVPAASIG